MEISIVLTNWGRGTHICVSELTIIGSDNGLSPIRRQAIIWTNAGILLIRTLGINFNEILIQIHTFDNKKMHLKMSSAKCQPFCLGLNVLILHLAIQAIQILLSDRLYSLSTLPNLTSDDSDNFVQHRSIISNPHSEASFLKSQTKAYNCGIVLIPVCREYTGQYDELDTTAMFTVRNTAAD